MARHTPLSDVEIAELTALLEHGAVETDRLRLYVSRMILDVLALRDELRRERERALLEMEAVRDVLARARPHLTSHSLDEDLRSLVAEIDDVLSGRRW